jgi:CheY-like chemotaxis protein
LLKRTRETKKTVSECLASIEKSSNHLLSLINDVLDMSRIEAGKVEMKSEPFNILSVLDSCVSIIKGQLEARDITFTTDTSLLKHPYVKGDKVRLQRIVTNILGNAVKFTPDGKSIRFKACEEDASETKVTYRLEFEDTGIGMSEEFQKKIFDPFSQEERPDFTAYKGTGLGMAITKQYVDAMGGKISLVSQIDKGSFFTVLLPLSLASPDEVLSLHQSLTPIPYLAGKKVLLVEDNEINMQIAQHLLEQTHCMVIAVKNGKEAVESFQKEKEGAISLILMDVMMPVMNGYQATQAIRALKRTDALSVKIVAMTANAFQEDFAKAKEAGMNDRLIKPIDKNLFYQIVTKYALEDKAS